MTQIPPEPVPDPQAQPPAPPPLPGYLPPPLPRPVLPLEYSTKSGQPGGSTRGRVGIGFIVYVALSVGWLFYASSARAHPRTIWGGWALMTTGLLGLALYLRLRYRYAGYGYGILLALATAVLLVLGLVLLIIGLCAGSKGRI